MKNLGYVLSYRRLPCRQSFQSTLFEDFSIEDPVTSHRHCRESTSCDRVADISQRLHERHQASALCRSVRFCSPSHQLIDTYTQTTTLGRIIHTILIKVAWIRFAEDYNSLRTSEKTAWLVSGFKLANPGIFADLDDGATKNKLKEHIDDLKAWKRKIGKDTTCRNRLRELFLEVCLQTSPFALTDGISVWRHHYTRSRLEPSSPT
jgi:hypothetical protein